MKKLRVGIVGTGGMANWHANAYKNDCKGVALAACMDVVPGRAEEFAKKHGVKHVVGKFDDLLAETDAVSVVTPDSTHAAYTLAALNAGKHVLCEKPLTVTLAEAHQVAAAAKAAGRRGQIHMINFSYRKAAGLQKAMAMVRAGDLGEIRHVHSSYLQSWLSCEAWGTWARPAMLWRLQTAAGSGGVLGDLGCHILDLTTAVAGDIKALRCQLATFPKVSPDGKFVTSFDGKPLDANDSALIQIEYANGALGLTHTSRWATGHLNSLRLEVHGTAGALMLDLDKSYDELNFCRGGKADKVEWTTEKLEPTPSTLQRFVHSIQSGQQDQPDILRGAQIQAYLDACFRAAKSGRQEKIEE